MKIVRTLPEAEWRSFVERHPTGNIFHTPEMFEVFAQTKGYYPTLWSTVDDRGFPLALMLPVQITLINSLFRPLTTRAVLYGSVLCAPGAEGREALALLLQTYRYAMKGNLLFTELRNLSDLSELQPVLTEYGFAYEEHLNYLIDLQRPVEKVWKSMHSNVRTNVKSAHRKGVIIEEVTSSDKIPVVYAVLAEVYRRIQVPLAPSSLLEAAFEILYPRHMTKFFVAQVGDTCIGAAIRLLYKNVIYAWYAGVNRDYASYKANDLLNWHVLEWGAQNGFSYFDFGGAGKPGEDYGPRKFKAKFGGELVNYGRNICIHAPIKLKLSRIGYQFLRRFL
jgi:hypothetical protein